MRNAVIAGLAGLAVGAAAVAGLGGLRGEREIGEQVRAYLLEHPEVLPEAMARLQARETGKLLAGQRTALETPFAGAWAGSAKPDVTLVQFFDYACGFCRASVPDLDRLLAEDKGLRIVFRELPILGPGSEDAARLSLAAAKAGDFLRFHRAMYAAGPPNPANIQRAATSAGLGQAPPTPDMLREIEGNLRLARALDLSGTPAFVVGDQVLNGAVGYDALKKAIADARGRS